MSRLLIFTIILLLTSCSSSTKVEEVYTIEYNNLIEELEEVCIGIESECIKLIEEKFYEYK